MKLTAEQIKLAQSCKTPEELMAKAQDAGLTLSLEQAKAALDSVSMVELNEDDIDVVSGGCKTRYSCWLCSQEYDGVPPHKVYELDAGVGGSFQPVCEQCYQQYYG